MSRAEILLADIFRVIAKDPDEKKYEKGYITYKSISIYTTKSVYEFRTLD